MIDEQKEKIELMAKNGKTIVQICRELDLEWRDVQKFLHSVDLKSWNGAKKVITLRLNRLVNENDPSKREKLAEEADIWIDYLYENGKSLRDKVERARKAMDGARRSLDG